MATEYLLEVKNVKAGYMKDVDVLRGINFYIEPGKIVAVIGPNGAGKSTLAKTIFGLLMPHTGNILFQGEDITKLKSNQIVNKGMSYVPQMSNVFPSLSVEENLEMGAFTHKTSIVFLKRRVFGMFPKLRDRRDQRAGTLSGGERQMLAMGRALMLEPTLLILDEPSAALSPILVTQVFEQIKYINQNGTAIILVEQNAYKALEMSHQAYLLISGRDEISGSGIDLLNNPQVREFYLGKSRH